MIHFLNAKYRTGLNVFSTASSESTKLKYNLLAFIANLLWVTDEDSLPEIAQYDPSPVFDCFLCF